MPRAAIVNKGKVNTRWFKDRLADKDITQRKLASILELDPAAVSLTLKGNRTPQVTEVEKMASVLGVTREAVLTNLGIEVAGGASADDTIPVVGWVDEDGVVHSGKVQGPTKVALPPGVPPEAVALRFQTNDSFDGWVAYFLPADHVRPESFTRLSVVTFQDGTQKLRIVRQGYEEGKHKLTTLARPTGEAESAVLKSATPVLWLKQ